MRTSVWLYRLYLAQECKPSCSTMHPSLPPVSPHCKVDAASEDGAGLSSFACDRRWELPSSENQRAAVSPFWASWGWSKCILSNHQGNLLGVGHSIHLFSKFREGFGHSKQAGWLRDCMVSSSGWTQSCLWLEPMIALRSRCVRMKEAQRVPTLPMRPLACSAVPIHLRA